MARSASATKKVRRPKIGDAGVFVRLPAGPLDAWISRQPAPKPSRPEAIRRLVELGLSADPLSTDPQREGRSSAKRAAGRSYAKAAAGKQIDLAGDPSATEKQRQSRKQRILKGPAEFREMRSDQKKR